MLAGYAVQVELSRGRRSLNRLIPIATTTSAIVIASSTPAPFAAWSINASFHAPLFRPLRNRLTHTIEVSQITRTVAAALALNVDLAERWPWCTISAILPSAMPAKRHSTLPCANITCSSITTCTPCGIVEDFEQPLRRFRGLNLTFEVREGSSNTRAITIRRSIRRLAEYLLDQRPPLEAQLVDLTDEIGYSTADLDDGYEAHLLTLDQIREGVPVFERFFREVVQIYPDVPGKLQFNEALKRVFNRMAGDLITHTQARLKQAGIETLADVRAHRDRLAAFNPEVEAERKQIKDFLYENLYYSPSLAGEKDDAERNRHRTVRPSG